MHAKTIARLMLLVLPVTVMGAGSAAAQITSPEGEYVTPHIVEITFPFQVGEKTLPAGKYDIEQPTRELLVFRPAKGAGVEAKVITRLAQPSAPLAQPKVVFDKVGDKYTVAEVWFPGRDGFLLSGTNEQHTHHTVKAAKKT
jgi:hypothetical protein